MTEKILIVDDDPELLRLIGMALQRAGYQPIAAKSAEEALEAVRTEHPALVILDIMLPGTSGIDVCRALRNNAQTLPLPIIILSARTQVDDKIEGLEAGADEYLTKPVSPKEMVARVTALLERTERLSQAAQTHHGRIFGFIGAKGGVGTTTVTVNVAVALAQKGKKVAAVELRPYYGTFPVQLGYEPHETLYDLLNHNKNSRLNERELKMHLIPDKSGLEILYAPVTPESWLQFEPERVEELLAQLTRLADYVLLDLPSDFSPATRAAVRCCDYITLVLRPEADSVASGKMHLELLKQWGVGRGVIDAVVVNQVPLAMGTNIQQISKELACDVVSVIPPAADACAMAFKVGRPLIMLQASDAAAVKLNQFAARLTQKE